MPYLGAFSFINEPIDIWTPTEKYCNSCISLLETERLLRESRTAEAKTKKEAVMLIFYEQNNLYDIHQPVRVCCPRVFLISSGNAIIILRAVTG